jgi:DNA-binding NtrC family response regulator
LQEDESENQPMNHPSPIHDTEMRRLLVVDDEPEMVSFLADALSEKGYQVRGAPSGAAALDALAENSFDLVISDVEMPDMRGIELLSAIHQRTPEQLVLLITAFGSIELAVQAVRAGACDFVAKPFTIEVLLLAIERAFRERQMRREIVRLRTTLPGSADGELVAKSTAMRTVLDLARRAAATDSTVLLTGESGTGKGAVARFIHSSSPRSAAPFVQVNCAALPAPLVESELFGARKGAFTDARDDRPGVFVEASGGTLFLDEIGEMPLEVQPKLLQALETGRVRPLGGSEVPVDIRPIAATNRPLEEALRERRFRPDLYYRLNVIRIEIPPLRDRIDDIEALVDIFLQRSAARLERPVIGVSAAAMRWLLAYDWPGNVRELANRIERAVALAEHDTLLVEDLVSSSSQPRGDEILDDAVARGLPLAEVERAYIRKMLRAVDGNKARAARLLGIDRRTLYRKIGGED